MHRIGCIIVVTFGVVLAIQPGVFAMEVAPQDVKVGVVAATARMVAEVKDFDVDRERIDDTQNFIIEAFQGVEEDLWTPRAVRSAAEVIAIGVFSRDYFGDEQLGSNEVIQFLPIPGRIYNSWIH